MAWGIRGAHAIDAKRGPFKSVRVVVDSHVNKMMMFGIVVERARSKGTVYIFLAPMKETIVKCPVTYDLVMEK